MIFNIKTPFKNLFEDGQGSAAPEGEFLRTAVIKRNTCPDKTVWFTIGMNLMSSIVLSNPLYFIS